MTPAARHIVVDARIRRTHTGRPVAQLLEPLQDVDTVNRYTVVLAPDDPWRPRNPNWGTVPCRYANFSLNPLQHVGFTRLLRRLEPDLVYFTLTGQQPLLFFGRQVTFTHDLTMFRCERTYGLPRWASNLRMLGYRLLVWQSHRKAARIVVPTDFVRDDVVRFHPFTAGRVVRAYEAGSQPKAERAERPPFAPDEFVLYVGSSFPHKNLRRLVEGFGLIQDRFPSARLLLVGERERYSRELERWARARPDAERVVFGGAASEAELRWLYEHAAACVMPSISEGFGLPGLEAMAHGCPVVSSTAACLPEVYGDAALYFDPTDPQELATRLGDVLASPATRSRLAEAGRRQAARYSWTTMAEDVHAVFADVLSSLDTAPARR